MKIKNILPSLSLALALTVSTHAADITPAEARAIAKEAYIYGFPLVDNYRIQYGYFVDKQNPEYKAPWNQIHNVPRVYTPADTAIQTPNSDTPYSFVGMDLRTEPIVLTVPVIEKERYFSIQLIDAYTFNFDYIGSRATGNEGGSYMVAGPNWKGETPKGVKKVFRSETEFVFAVYRTQLFKSDDLDNVKKVQAGIYGNDAAEAMYPMTKTLADGEPLDASKHNYTLTFAAGQFPPVNAFWSVTMYDGKSQLLIKNPINRYLINSPMLPGMKKNADGGVTLYIQKGSPGADKESNWLPAPNDLVYLVMRLYWPKTEPPSILPPGEGTWKPPGIAKVK